MTESKSVRRVSRQIALRLVEAADDILSASKGRATRVAEDLLAAAARAVGAPTARELIARARDSAKHG